MNLSRYLEISAERFPDKVAVRHEGQVITYKCPRVIRIQKEPLPKSGTGKILKKQIRNSMK